MGRFLEFDKSRFNNLVLHKNRAYIQAPTDPNSNFLRLGVHTPSAESSLGDFVGPQAATAWARAAIAILAMTHRL